ncbi:unnamed protein product, partial [Owenia fusiformis]
GNPLIASISPTYNSLAFVYKKMMKQYNWTNVLLLHADYSDDIYNSYDDHYHIGGRKRNAKMATHDKAKRQEDAIDVIKEVFKSLENDDLNFSFESFSFPSNNDYEKNIVLEKIKRMGRIIILLLEEEQMIEVLRLSKKINFDQKEFMFILTYELIPKDKILAPWLRNGTSEDMHLFDNVFQVTASGV